MNFEVTTGSRSGTEVTCGGWGKKEGEWEPSAISHQPSGKGGRASHVLRRRIFPNVCKAYGVSQPQLAGELRRDEGRRAQEAKVMPVMMERYINAPTSMNPAVRWEAIAPVKLKIAPA